MTTKGKIDLYTWTTPNGFKISIFLEEAGIPYNVHAVNIGKQEQFDPKFLAISPNNKIPAIVDHDVEGEPVKVFESGAILIYLADKYNKFIPPTTKPNERATVLQWVFWQMSGLGPTLGQIYHFSKSASEKIPYAIERFTNEGKRLLGVLDKQLSTNKYVAGAEYTIADIITYPWIRGVFKYELIPAQEYANVKRWADEIEQRPAVQKGLAVPEVTTPAK